VEHEFTIEENLSLTRGEKAIPEGKREGGKVGWGRKGVKSRGGAECQGTLVITFPRNKGKKGKEKRKREEPGGEGPGPAFVREGTVRTYREGDPTSVLRRHKIRMRAKRKGVKQGKKGIKKKGDHNQKARPALALWQVERGEGKASGEEGIQFKSQRGTNRKKKRSRQVTRRENKYRDLALWEKKNVLKAKTKTEQWRGRIWAPR